MFFLQFIPRHYAEVLQQAFDSRYPLAGGADMPPLPSKRPSLRSQTIVCGKCNDPAPKQFRGGVEHSPPDGTVPNIKGKVKIGAF